ncbi:Hypothetical predicted protein, partial [Mytilus galloprovincialis]
VVVEADIRPLLFEGSSSRYGNHMQGCNDVFVEFSLDIPLLIKRIKTLISGLMVTMMISYGNHDRVTVSRMSCESREIFLRPSCDSRTIIVFIKMVYVGTHDNVFIAQQSHDCVRHSYNSHKTVTRRAKKVHVQFSSHDIRQHHDAQNIVRLSYDDHRLPTI